MNFFKNCKKVNVTIMYYLLANILCIASVILTCIKLSSSLSKSPELMFSIGADSLGICVVSVMIHSCLKNKQLKRPNIKFERFLFAIIITLFSDLCYWLIDGIDNKVMITLNYLYNMLYHIMTMVSVYLFARYIEEQKWIKNKVIKVYIKIFNIYLIFLLVVFIINCFFPILFYFENGKFVRTNIALLFYAMDYLFILGILTFIKFKVIPKRNLYLLAYYVALPVISAVIQIMIMNVSLLSCSLVIETTVIFVLDYNVQQFRLVSAQQENENTREKLMLSQIQPHFVYNTLTTIAYLCKTNPDQAQELTVKFSQFLRNNVDFKSQDDLIPFEKELESVKNYLEIEKIRFGDRLEISYNIEVKDFSLPMLTLQPLVENAVKHGICKRKEGGSVTIATFEDDNYYHLLVKDNGVGFNPDAPFGEGEIHVGLNNVKNRIEKITNGEIVIESVIGKGTNILVNIPKKGN